MSRMFEIGNAEVADFTMKLPEGRDKLVLVDAEAFHDAYMAGFDDGVLGEVGEPKLVRFYNVRMVDDGSQER